MLSIYLYYYNYFYFHLHVYLFLNILIYYLYVHLYVFLHFLNLHFLHLIYYALQQLILFHFLKFLDIIHSMVLLLKIYFLKQHKLYILNHLNFFHHFLMEIQKKILYIQGLYVLYLLVEYLFELLLKKYIMY